MHVTMEKHVAPLAILSSLGLLLLIAVLVPVSEWSAVFLYLFVAIVIAVILYRWIIRPVDLTFPVSLFVLAFTLKLISSVIRYWTVVDVYAGAADAVAYVEEGTRVAQYFRVFDLSLFDWYQFRGEGTTRMVYITGVLFSMLPTSLPGATIFFATLAFCGSGFFYRALRVASPDSSPNVFRLLIFFLPSILFWPSSLGKDAWVFFCSGLVAWGWVVFARKRQILGLAVVAVALILIYLVRPHIAAFLAIALAAGFLAYGTTNIRNPVIWMMGGAIIVALAIFAVRAGQEFLQLQDFSLEAVEELYAEQQLDTTAGGSQYQAVSVFTPSGAVIGLLTSLARPFPWEAHNFQTLLASLETVVWLVFCFVQRRVFLGKMRSLRTDPVAAMALTYSVIILLALTSIGNFGIIARQRVMMLPFLWMLFV